MIKKYILSYLFGFLAMAAWAQTPAQAKALYEKGQYSKAKPAYEKLLKSQPANGNYNLWYGVCCLKTDDAAKAIKPLETAVKKRVASGQLYLAQAYHELYRFEEAIDVYENYIADLSKLKRPTEEAEKQLEKSKAGLRYLKGVEKVCFIDSIVVNKDEFLKAYKISRESGQLFTYSNYFKEESEKEATVYETELGNKIYYAERQPDGTLSILSKNKMLDEWSKGTLLPGSINEAVNANYPYVMTDGVTIYYAADGHGSMGGYDIFVTRYNNNTYLMPENVGMPFNSPYNDYMYVIDEFNNLGWFASDRHQPEGKVCIYVFIPNASKQVYNYEATEQSTMIGLGRLSSIKETWTSQNQVTEAQQRLQNIGKGKTETKNKYDFAFVIDDRNTYHQFTEFRSEQAKASFNQYLQLEKGYKQRVSKLEEMRNLYANANKNEKDKITPAILDMEKHLLQLTDEIEQAAIKVRNQEKKAIK